MLLATTLIGCSAAVDYLPEVGAAPDLHQPEILGQVATLATSLGSAGPVDLAEPIRSQPINAEPWLVCLHLERTAAHPERMYALLFKDAKLEKWRPAAIVDRCEDQQFRSTALPKPDTAKPPAKS